MRSTHPEVRESELHWSSAFFQERCVAHQEID
jgi:hypothetical protein